MEEKKSILTLTEHLNNSDYFHMKHVSNMFDWGLSKYLFCHSHQTIVITKKDIMCLNVGEKRRFGKMCRD